MKLTIDTPVAGDYLTVFAGFTKDLFVELTPPGVPVELLRFDGSKTGNEVHLELSFPGFKQKWISEITSDACDDEECYFIDEGRTLPFFLSHWRHAHRIRKDGEGARIIDDIEFRCPIPGMALFVYPVLFRQFRARGPVYQRIFGKPP
ncbi:MAG: hypothetical protein RIF32_13285 [Leptospirales bacterium]|jgi:ligand-binding SRPBCC domain-containing protein